MPWLEVKILLVTSLRIFFGLVMLWLLTRHYISD